MTDPDAWAARELDLMGFVVVGGWRGHIAKMPATALVVASGDEVRLVYYDPRVRALRSVPLAEGVPGVAPPEISAVR